MSPNLQETADLLTFAEEILNGKLHILCSNGVVLETLTNSSDLRRVSGFFKELEFQCFKISKVRASVCVTIYTIMYKITNVRIYIKNYCKSLLVYY